MRWLRYIWTAWKILWPLPYTLFGLAFLLIPIRGDRQLVYYRGTLGVMGKAIERILRRVPIQGGAAAMTLGHTILAVDRQAFIGTWSHERVHVQQYERWGLLFGPLYLGASLMLKLRDKDPYWDNPFEEEARRLEGTD